MVVGSARSAALETQVTSPLAGQLAWQCALIYIDTGRDHDRIRVCRTVRGGTIMYNRSSLNNPINYHGQVFN